MIIITMYPSSFVEPRKEEKKSKKSKKSKKKKGFGGSAWLTFDSSAKKAN